MSETSRARLAGGSSRGFPVDWVDGQSFFWCPNSPHFQHAPPAAAPAPAAAPVAPIDAFERKGSRSRRTWSPMVVACCAGRWSRFWVLLPFPRTMASSRRCLAFFRRWISSSVSCCRISNTRPDLELLVFTLLFVFVLLLLLLLVFVLCVRYLDWTTARGKQHGARTRHGHSSGPRALTMPMQVGLSVLHKWIPTTASATFVFVALLVTTTVCGLSLLLLLLLLLRLFL
mmetsp:Transcript_16291/g.35379  ORF Transcript_16291/g.35379 Transcript_16291/m.35379 type:complete len:229 (+) Transcript_16291:144-830(+)